MAKQTFTVGQVLTAAQVTALQTNEYNQTVSVKTASYTLVAADVGTRIEMNSGSATTVTVNTALFSAGDTLVIQNKGAGVSTVTAGTATVSTSGTLALAQYDQGTLYFVSTGVAIFFNATAGANSIPKSILTTNGDMIYATGASTPVRLGIGSSAQVLTVVGGIPSWATPAASASGLTLISPTSIANTTGSASTSAGTTTATGTASVSLNGVFSASYDNYMVVISGASFNTASGNLLMRMRASGTDTTTAYYYGGIYVLWNGTSGSNNGSNVGGVDVLGLTDAATAINSSTTIVSSPFLSQTTSFQASQARHDAGQYNGGILTNTTSYDGLTLTHATKLLTAKIRVYGIGQ